MERIDGERRKETDGEMERDEMRKDGWRELDGKGRMESDGERQMGKDGCRENDGEG
ncbi:hypothetical protein A2U01_0071496 [Trifolium medium]|uniref:Uncharacterized protein n=1 Tax=Trifolium medium TaxID=97028 RepID=A0A392SPA4_9FABA|nr:hypothetical protein [Trifolium medium]